MSYFVLDQENIDNLKDFINSTGKVILYFKEQKEKPEFSYQYHFEKGISVSSIIPISSTEQLEKEIYNYAATLSEDFELKYRYENNKKLNGYSGLITMSLY